jgi:hypothetical protein
MNSARQGEVALGLLAARIEAFVLAESLRGKPVPEIPAVTQVAFDGLRGPL